MIKFTYAAEGDEEPKVDLVMDEPCKLKQVARIAHMFTIILGRFDDEVGKEAMGFLLQLPQLNKQKSGDNKQLIIAYLCGALNATRFFNSPADYSGDIRALHLEYDAEKEKVHAKWGYAEKDINVAMDSGIAMIRDVLRGLEII